jgi:hypothetical protein
VVVKVYIYSRFFNTHALEAIKRLLWNYDAGVDCADSSLWDGGVVVVVVDGRFYGASMFECMIADARHALV